MTPMEAAAKLKISRRRIYELIQYGEIEATNTSKHGGGARYQITAVEVVRYTMEREV